VTPQAKPSPPPRAADAPAQEAPPPPAPGGRTPVAIVGAGYIADFHLSILRETPGLEVVAVADVDAERARRMAARFGVPHAVSGAGLAAELARLGVRIAHVLVPPDRHVAVTRELLEHDIGCFVEKPLAPSLAEARELVELAEQRGLAFGVNHNAPFHPAFARLLERLRGGEIGALEHVAVTLSVPLRQLDAGDFSHWMFRSPRNVVLEQAPHPFAQLVELVGRVREADVSILGTRELGPGRPFHDRWVIAARGERGTAHVHLAFGHPFTRNRIEVLGTDGALEVDLHHGLLAVERKTKWLDFWNSFLAGYGRGSAFRRGAWRTLFGWVRTTLGLGPRSDAFYAGMRGSILEFHAALAAGREPRMNGRHALAVLEWCEAVLADVAEPPLPAEPRAPADTQRPPRPNEVCVLGGTGFIGRPTLRALAASGAPVTALVRRTRGLPPELAAPPAPGAAPARLVPGRLEDPVSLAAAVRGARTVLHLATGGGSTWEDVERAMVRGTEALARACLEAGVERLVFVSSTAALYLGRDCGVAVLEDEVGPDPRPEERAPYARGKIEAERALVRIARAEGLRVTIVRPAIVMGPGAPLQHSGLGLWVRDNHCVGWGLGRRPVPLVLVDDVADALARVALHEGPELDGKALNLSTRSGLTPRRVVAAFAAATGRALHFHPRPLELSQAMEVGKWVVKRIGRRRDAFPSWRDLKSREMRPELACRTARDVLGWRPCDDPEELLRRVLAGRATPRGANGEGDA